MTDWSRTTLGLKGGSTSLCSNSCQLMLLKKGCKRMLPTIPSLRVGSLSNSCQVIRVSLRHNRKKKQNCSICCSPDPFQQVLGLLVDPARIMGRVHADGLKQLVLIVSVERRLTNQHLIQQDSKGPPVHGEGILLTQQDLSPKTSLRFRNTPNAFRLTQPNCSKWKSENKSALPLVQFYLGSDVIRSSAERRGAVLPKHVLLAHAKVGDLYMTLVV